MPRRPLPGWAAPGSGDGDAVADEPTTEQSPPYREAPTAELAVPVLAPPPFAPPPEFRSAPFESAPPAAPPAPYAAAPSRIPPPPLPPVEPADDASPNTGLPTSPPTYDPSPFGGGGGGRGPLPPLPAYARPDPVPGRGTSRSILAIVAACSAVAAALVTGFLLLTFDRDEAAPVSAPNTRLENSTGLDIQALLAKAQPSVVTIHTDDASSSQGEAGAGTGVIVSNDGDILTNAHVVARAQTVRVTLDDGSQHPASVIGSFPDADVALVRVEGVTDFTPAQLGTSADALVGDEVVAIGNALNLGASPSVTRGIISALDRIIEAPDVTLRGLIQTDAAINPGNSGGPLINARGEVIGINTAIAADAQNIGFAIPIDAIKPLIEDLRQGRGEVTPETAFLGVSSQSVSDLTSDLLDQYGISASRGAVITEVTPDSAAARAGLEVGDVIVSLDGDNVGSAQDLIDAIRAREAGDGVVIEYERDGRQREVTVELDRRGG